jgi:glycosyltransferase involved in cell wall biosynthesis
MTHPEVAHVHNIYHHLSPSILGALKGHGIPIVMTLHDYKVICPTYQLLAPDGVCERCRGGRFYQAVVHRCSKDSLSASLLVATEAYVHRFLGSYDQVDLFVCPSRFLLERMVAHGLPRARLVHIPNFAPLDEFRPSRSAARGEYAIYFGRLAPEKGLGTLLKAIAKVRRVPLVIVGDGSEEERLKKQARELELTNVSFLPRVEKHALADLVAGARFAVLPSEWYENCSISVLESFALGRAVVGARIGGMPELIEDGATGLLFRPGDADELAAKLDSLYADPRAAEELGVQARRRAEADFSPRKHIEQITQIYRRVTKGAQARSVGRSIPENLHERRLS